VSSGVDCRYYAPPADAPSRRDVLYVGCFQNLPDVDDFEYLAADVWPLVRLRVPGARLDVVGDNTSYRIRRFDGQNGISVLGEVADLRGACLNTRNGGSDRAGSIAQILEAFMPGSRS
jgi:hypothetical protein